MALPLDVTAPLYSALLALRKAPASEKVYKVDDLRRLLIAFLKPRTVDGKLALSPREFSGTPGTCVCGRVVILRGPVQYLGRSVRALEIHLLGNGTNGDVLFLCAVMERWQDVFADQVRRAMELGKVYSISGGVLVNRQPLNSTSRMPYFLKITPPLGVNTIIKECNESLWNDIPAHHPFTDIIDFHRFAVVSRRPAHVIQICVVGMVCHQPGVRECWARDGRTTVCNAIIKQGRSGIRCAFWRHHAAKLAAFPVGAVVALMQVIVVQREETGFELFAVEATQVMECPAALAESIRATTIISLLD